MPNLGKVHIDSSMVLVYPLPGHRKRSFETVKVTCQCLDCPCRDLMNELQHTLMRAGQTERNFASFSLCQTVPRLDGLRIRSHGY